MRAWAIDNVEGFGPRFARANMLGVYRLKDDILEISDDGTGDRYVDSDGNTRVDGDVVQRSKLRVESRRWLLSKLLPKEFGDRLDVNHAVTVSIAEELSEVRRRRLLIECDVQARADAPALAAPIIEGEM